MRKKKFDGSAVLRQGLGRVNELRWNGVSLLEHVGRWWKVGNRAMADAGA